MSCPVLVWLRQDLRLADQPAFRAAATEGPVVPVYILDDISPGTWKIGGAQRWWLHHSLAALTQGLAAAGSRLILRRGEWARTLSRLLGETGATRIHAIRHYEPWHVEAERRVAGACDLVLREGNQLAPIVGIRTGTGQPFKVYTPFWRALAKTLPPPEPQPAPAKLAVPETWPASERLEDWRLLPTGPNWAAAFPDHWRPGEVGAHANLETFAGGVPAYLERRNLPSEAGTSRLSPHLHHGEISPATVWHAAARHGPDIANKYLKELAWRDFTANIIAGYPDYADRHARPAFDRFPWRTLNDPIAQRDFAAWTSGRTGYPIVDAGMRELWAMGWMHNRVRMLAASFLVKHLLIDWRDGERWFWDTLVDADLGNNSVNWQWIAGSGLDPNPFGRIMNPLLQSAKFGAGDYIRRWVPELSALTDEEIHDPDEAGARPAAYPAKIIGHKEARARALAAARAMAD